VLTADIALNEGTTPTYTGTWPLTIQGGGHWIDGLELSAVLYNEQADVAITDLEVLGGPTDGAAVQGGFVGDFDVVRSYFHDNLGGDVAMGREGELTIDASTFIGRGSVGTSGGSPEITNSTFANHRVAVDAGADQNGGYAATIVHSTFAGNSTDVSAAVLDGSASVFASGCDLADSDGTVEVSSPYSWARDASCLLTDPTNRVGGDPELEPLDTSYATPSRAPAELSPLVDVVPADQCVVSVDQRNEPRPQGFGCDLGAVERGERGTNPPPTSIPEGPPPTTTPPTGPPPTTVPVAPPPPAVPSAPSYGGPVSGSPTYAG
jgi:hypothetical protein